ncbi:MAG: hypothetical protein CMF59_11855 [Leptospiraceae bacterium]|nr:hypothetical protein [Leptospiraceae bacterium]
MVFESQHGRVPDFLNGVSSIFGPGQSNFQRTWTPLWQNTALSEKKDPTSSRLLALQSNPIKPFSLMIPGGLLNLRAFRSIDLLEGIVLLIQ